MKTNINQYILQVLSIKLRYKLYFSFSIPTPGFPPFYYILGANLGLLLYGEFSVMSGGWKGEQEKLCAMKRRLGSEIISPPAGLEPEIRSREL